MLNYADYQFYVDEYKGGLSDDLFNSLIIKSSREIDKNINIILTQTKIENLSDEEKYQLKYVACEMCDFINKNKSSASSISIDGISKTMKSSDEIRQDKINILNGLPISLTRYL